jgi:hypothetical protein
MQNIKEKLDKATAYIADVVMSDETSIYLKQIGLNLLIELGNIPDTVKKETDDIEIRFPNNTFAFNLTKEEYKRIADIIKDSGYNNNIKAIIELRKITSCGLKVAKDLIEHGENWFNR